MAVPRYPHLQFPLPLRDSYSYTVDMGLLRTTINTSIPRQARRYTSMQHFFSMEFAVPISLLYLWQSWMNIYGYKWFEIPLMHMGTATQPPCTNFTTVRLISDLEMAVISQKVLSVRVSAELAAGMTG